MLLAMRFSLEATSMPFGIRLLPFETKSLQLDLGDCLERQDQPTFPTNLLLLHILPLLIDACTLYPSSGPRHARLHPVYANPSSKQTRWKQYLPDHGVQANMPSLCANGVHPGGIEHDKQQFDRPRPFVETRQVLRLCAWVHPQCGTVEPITDRILAPFHLPKSEAILLVVRHILVHYMAEVPSHRLRLKTRI